MAATLDRVVAGAGAVHEAKFMLPWRSLRSSRPRSVVADDEIAGHQVDLLPVVMDEKHGGVDTGIELQQARAAAHLPGLVEIAREKSFA
jgi:hypothetical protein